MVTLREVLSRFEQQSGTISLPAMARELGTEQAMLQEMINYWVRKGRLRESTSSTCTTCGGAQGCPFVFALPRSYELAGGDAPEVAACPHGGCH